MMRGLAALIGCGWLGLTFYALGPLSSDSQIGIAALVLGGGCGLAVILGAWRGLNRHRVFASPVRETAAIPQSDLTRPAD